MEQQQTLIRVLARLEVMQALRDCLNTTSHLRPFFRLQNEELFWLFEVGIAATVAALTHSIPGLMEEYVLHLYCFAVLLHNEKLDKALLFYPQSCCAVDAQDEGAPSEDTSTDNPLQVTLTAYADKTPFRPGNIEYRFVFRRPDDGTTEISESLLCFGMVTNTMDAYVHWLLANQVESARRRGPLNPPFLPLDPQGPELFRPRIVLEIDVMAQIWGVAGLIEYPFNIQHTFLLTPMVLQRLLSDIIADAMNGAQLPPMPDFVVATCMASDLYWKLDDNTTYNTSKATVYILLILEEALATLDDERQLTLSFFIRVVSCGTPTGSNTAPLDSYS